jgi:hypothetical protein
VDEELRSRGVQFLESSRSGSDRNLVNRTTVVVGEDVRYRVEGMGTGLVAEFATRSAHVRRFLLDADAAARATSDPPIVPYTKAAQVGPKKSRGFNPLELVGCPACDGAGWEECCLCNGAGEVPPKTANAYRSG